LTSEKVPLSEFCTVRKGLSYKGEYIHQEGPALLGIGTIKEGGGFRPENIRTYGGPYKQEHVLHPGDVYVALTSQDGFLIGSPAMVPKDFDSIGITTHHDAKIDWKIEDPTMRDFLYWLMHSYQFIRHCQNFSVGTTVYATHTRDVERFLVPEKLNQNQIIMTRMLNFIYDVKKNSHDVKENIESQIEALFRSWFIDFDPVRAKAEGKLPFGMDGETAALFPDSFEDSEIGPIPADWKYGKLGDCLSIIESGKRPKGGAEQISDGVPSIGAESINGVGNFEISNLKLISDGFFSQMKKGIVENGDVMLYKDGAHVGRVAMFDRDYPFAKCAINEHVFRLRTNGHLTQHFLYCMMSNQQLRWHLECRAIKAAQPGLNQKDLVAIPIVIPSLEVVDKFTERVKPLFDKIFEDAKENQQYAEVRNAILPRLMSGE
tara:strand:- start:4165 stop:5460 length:1296 start_codon:yes stop_codon:yes gene_type:complete